MSEDGEMWAEIRKENQEKRWANKEKSISILTKKGFIVACLDEATAHYRIDGKINFWPTTGTFHDPKTGIKGRGVFNLIKYLKKFYENK